MHDLEDLVRRYLALWQVPDPCARSAAVAELFTEDVTHYSANRAVHGLEEMAARVAAAYEAWVEPGKYILRSAVNADGHHGAVRFNWEVVAVEYGDVAGVGFEFLLLAEDGRIRIDYQFIDSPPPLPDLATIGPPANGWGR
jgi:SnoaL-like domain